MQNPRQVFLDTLPEIRQDYGRKLFFFLQQLTGARRVDCEDMVQEVYFRLVKNAHKFNIAYSLATWLYTIARNIGRDYTRKRRRWNLLLKHENGDSSSENEWVDRSAGTEDCVLREDARRAVRAVLDGLGEDDRVLLFLRFYEDFKYEDIARIIKKPLGTVKYRFHLLKKELRPRLEAYIE